jgi:predicted metal-dependent hydrolase
MPSQEFMLDGNLAVTIYKRKTNRNIRLSIAPSGEVRVSIPAWAPYKAGLAFAKSRQAWIRDLHNPVKPLKHGQAVGKAHHLQFVPKTSATKASSRVYNTAILISFPRTAEPDAAQIQRIAREASVRALRAQAEQLLPQRLAGLAKVHGFVYTSVSIKRLKSRWGSCDQQANIVLNLFLMQLPWELIDYVLLHELTHTNILRHGPDFWQALEASLPNMSALKKTMRAYQPVLTTIG